MRLYYLEVTFMSKNARFMLVRAKDARRARRFAAENCGDEGPDVWLDPEQSTCTSVKQEGKPGLIAAY